MASDKSPEKGPGRLNATFHPHTLSRATRAVHADDYINVHRAVAPPLQVSTTFRYNDDPAELRAWDNTDPHAPYDSHTYSRDTAPNTTRFEAILSDLIGQPTLTYASGMAAFHAMIVFLNPRRVAIGAGYHGCHGVLDVMKKLNGLEKLDLLSASDLDKLQPGDVVHVETPLNPTGEARDLAHYARIAQAKGCYLTVDATFAPPPLLDPFQWGADVVMHSGSKYFGGHSDILCGVLSVHKKYIKDPASREAKDNWIAGLKYERLVIGGVMGNLEGWLGVRSMRTLELRVERQSKNAAQLVAWLAAEQKKEGSLVSQVVERIHHASLQPEAADKDSWLNQQMPRGFGPVFSVVLRNETQARRLPSKLELFHHATSLGGVESLIEWRAMTDPHVDRRLLRLSIGVEGWEDIQADLERAFAALIAEDAAANKA
ncbi:hypothetical protein SBRCBS47491_005959 [Sporothrix bragantina]|uniref:Cystathionine gamma-synthase n=1 Tax=Sporothrix bragantina TaxID=671064 RepID=A0ABP0C0X3_9PEZI